METYLTKSCTYIILIFFLIACSQQTTVEHISVKPEINAPPDNNIILENHNQKESEVGIASDFNQEDIYVQLKNLYQDVATTNSRIYWQTQFTIYGLKVTQDQKQALVDESINEQEFCSLLGAKKNELRQKYDTLTDLEITKEVSFSAELDLMRTYIQSKVLNIQTALTKGQTCCTKSVDLIFCSAFLQEIADLEDSYITRSDTWEETLDGQLYDVMKRYEAAIKETVPKKTPSNVPKIYSVGDTITKQKYSVTLDFASPDYIHYEHSFPTMGTEMSNDYTAITEIYDQPQRTIMIKKFIDKYSHLVDEVESYHRLLYMEFSVEGTLPNKWHKFYAKSYPENKWTRFIYIPSTGEKHSELLYGCRFNRCEYLTGIYFMPPKEELVYFVYDPESCLGEYYIESGPDKDIIESAIHGKICPNTYFFTLELSNLEEHYPDMIR